MFTTTTRVQLHSTNIYSSRILNFQDFQRRVFFSRQNYLQGAAPVLQTTKTFHPIDALEVWSRDQDPP